jgi:hypothetical protein
MDNRWPQFLAALLLGAFIGGQARCPGPARAALHDGESQSPTFSTTPAFDCTAGNQIHVTGVNATITSLSMTSGLYPGQLCMFSFVHDNTANAYTLPTRQSNIKTNSATQSMTSNNGTYVWELYWNSAASAWEELRFQLDN